MHNVYILFTKVGKTPFALLPLILILALPHSLSAQYRNQHIYLKTHGGLSSYLGDNNTSPFNRDVFNIDGKWPYSYGFEIGYERSTRWRFGLGAVLADYPIITRFTPDLQVDSHPTKRTSIQAVAQYALNSNRLHPFLMLGMHLTVGNVSIFEASKLADNQVPRVGKHYIWGPVFGVGLDYALSPGLSMIAQFSTNVTFVDDSADGRLPLGPPLPTNLRKKDRFAPFDLLSGLSLGLSARPVCFSECQHKDQSTLGNLTATNPGLLRFSRALNGGLTSFHYHFNPFKSPNLYLGISTGIGPKMIEAQFVYPDGLIEDDLIFFTDAFAGLSFHYFGSQRKTSPITLNAGLLAAIPRQVQFNAGFDYYIKEAFSIGLEGRYTFCPTRDQTFYKNEVVHIMSSSCEYRFGMGITTGFRL